MTRWRTAMAVLSAALGAACTPVHEYRRIVMGAECRILVAADEATADRAEVFVRINRLIGEDRTLRRRREQATT